MLKKVNDKTMLTDTSYSFSKELVTLYIPAISSAYFALAQIWGFPDPEKVIGTLAILATFLGAVMHISSRNYDSSGAGYDGNAVVTQHEGGGLNYSLEFDGDPADIKDLDSVSFKVVHAPTIQDTAPENSSQ